VEYLPPIIVDGMSAKRLLCRIYVSHITAPNAVRCTLCWAHDIWFVYSKWVILNCSVAIASIKNAKIKEIAMGP